MESKAVTTRIQATSRMSVKIKENFYTIELLEERQLSPDCDLELEKQRLFDSVNATVDNQIQEIVNGF